jgi:hypothetical protein
MARRVAVTEANRNGKQAAEMGKRGRLATPTRYPAPSWIVRMPSQYTSRDIRLLLDALWSMFTQSQAERLVVAMPWDESDEPRLIVLADLASVLESWLD